MPVEGYLKTKAMPVSMTFRDFAAFTASVKIHVREGTSVEDCRILIDRVVAVQIGQLADYTIGYHKTFVSSKPASDHHASGGVRWLVSYRAVRQADESDDKHHFAIPCANLNLLAPSYLKDQADLSLSEWKAFLEIFLRVGVSEEGFPIQGLDTGNLKITKTNYNWPPKGQRGRK